MEQEQIIRNLEKAIEICDSTPHEDKDEVMDSIEEAIEIINNSQ